MVAIVKAVSSVSSGRTRAVLVELGIICAAGLFVSVLLMTYGIDLSPGFF